MALLDSPRLRKKLVFGLGQTGLSCVRYFVDLGYSVVVFDTRKAPPLIDQLYEEFPHVACVLGEITQTLFDDVDQIILSPGLSLKSTELQQAFERNIEIVGDIEIFAANAKAPIIAITGSNGKTTTTTLVTEVFKAAGHMVATGGNIGKPVLALLSETVPDFYVLELSSFQLETTANLRPEVAVLLNISEDHMDRYSSLDEYASTKLSLLENASTKIINLDDEWIQQNVELDESYTGFTSAEPNPGEYGLRKFNSQEWIVSGQDKIFKTGLLKLKGKHQLMNAIAVMAIADACAIDREVVNTILGRFDGLEHRTQYVETIDGVEYINDSKGTNVGATVAAINGLDSQIILIAGGDGKGADFSPLIAAIKNQDVKKSNHKEKQKNEQSSQQSFEQSAQQKVKQVILIGRDAGLIETAISNVAPVMRAVSLEAAVSLAQKKSVTGDAVLFSPACASFDMFENYQHRGDVFIKAVKELKHHGD